MNYREYIENNTLRLDAGYRGGGIEIDVSEAFKNDYGIDMKMSAYQNYLGGGMLGSVNSACNFNQDVLSKGDYIRFVNLRTALKKYFHNLTNHEDEFESQTYESNQKMPSSAY